MSRNKYPEETIEKILHTASQLFMEKGYDKTSMQDIIDRLGMSKGAIYYHFKSKEDLLKGVSAQHFGNIEWFYDIIESTSLNALEKLRAVFSHEFITKQNGNQLSRPLLRDPKVIMGQFDSSVNEIAPLLTKIIEKGNEDGSLHAPYPKESAELLLIALNMWINPAVLLTGKVQFLRKILYLKLLMDASGIPVFDASMLEISENYYDAAVDSHIQSF